MILSLKIAFKFHRSYRGNVLISLVSILSMLGISIGVAISIITLSIMNGFEYELNKRILSIIPHGEIIPVHYQFYHWKSVLNKVKTIPGIIKADPYINFTGIVEFNNKWNLVHVKSINLTENCSVYHNMIMNFIEKKSWEHFCKYKNQIILGKGISNNLNIKPGDWINILFMHYPNLKNKFSSPIKIQAQVSGILNLNSQFDENIAIISLSDAKNYCNNQTNIDGIEIVVSNVFGVRKIVQKIYNICPEHIYVTSWMDTYGYIYRDIQIIRLIIYLSAILIIGISCFNITTTLILSIKNKFYDIIILRSLGVCREFIQFVFLWHGLAMYGIASVLGSFIGILVSLNLNEIILKCINISKSKILIKGIYFINFIPSKCNILEVLILLIVVCVLGLSINWYVLFKTNPTKFTRILK